MQRARAFLGFACLALCLGCGQRGAEEPRHQGKTLTEWVAQLEDDDPNRQTDAILAVGEMAKAGGESAKGGSVTEAALPVLKKILQQSKDESGIDSFAISLIVVEAMANMGPEGSAIARAEHERDNETPEEKLRRVRETMPFD